MTTVITLRFPTFKESLTVERVPQFLRFTVAGPMSKGTWEALDQLDDVAKPDEQILAARLKSKGTIHIDRVVKKKKVGEWLESAEYVLVDDGPPEAVLRSNELWREWCMMRAALETESKGT